MTYTILNKPFYNILFLSFVSTLIIVLQQGEINRDGILYITVAQHIIEGNWDKALSLYNWPFFSLLIASLNQYLGISLQNAAHVINVSLFVLASFFFIKNVSLVSQNKISIFFATLILITSIPLMDNYLSMILRDHGQWAGFMIGVYGYLRWVKNHQWFWAFFWQVGFIFGTLFRPECIIFSILLPFIHQLFVVKTERLKALIQSISIPLISFLVLIIFWLSFNIYFNTDSLHRLNELVTIPARIISMLLQPLNIDTEDLYLRTLIYDYALSFKYFFLLYVFAYKWVAGVGIFHFLLFLYAIKQRLIISPYFKILAILFLFSSSIVIANLFSKYIITTRYLVINFWIVYIVAAIGAGHLWQTLLKSKNPKKIWIMRGLVATFFIYFFNVVFDSPGKHFEHEAGDWVKNNEINLNNIYFSSNRAAYYSGLLSRNFVDLKYATDVIQYDFLVITYDRFSVVEDILNYHPIKYFPSQKKPKVIIYKRNTLS